MDYRNKTNMSVVETPSSDIFGDCIVNASVEGKKILMKYQIETLDDLISVKKTITNIIHDRPALMYSFFKAELDFLNDFHRAFNERSVISYSHEKNNNVADLETKIDQLHGVMELISQQTEQIRAKIDLFSSCSQSDCQVNDDESTTIDNDHTLFQPITPDTYVDVDTVALPKRDDDGVVTTDKTIDQIEYDYRSFIIKYCEDNRPDPTTDDVFADADRAWLAHRELHREAFERHEQTVQVKSIGKSTMKRERITKKVKKIKGSRVEQLVNV
jgi:hypothetical protein